MLSDLQKAGIICASSCAAGLIGFVISLEVLSTSFPISLVVAAIASVVGGTAGCAAPAVVKRFQRGANTGATVFAENLEVVLVNPMRQGISMPMNVSSLTGRRGIPFAEMRKVDGIISTRDMSIV